MNDGFKVLTEAQENDGGLIRDLVDLSNGEVYEFETTPKRAARFLGKPINIVPVGWDFEDKRWIKLKEKAVK